MTTRKKGDKYRPVVTILKVKRGLPTKILVSGQEYALIHKDQYMGGKKRRPRAAKH